MIEDLGKIKVFTKLNVLLKNPAFVCSVYVAQSGIKVEAAPNQAESIFISRIESTYSKHQSFFIVSSGLSGYPPNPESGYQQNKISKVPSQGSPKFEGRHPIWTGHGGIIDSPDEDDRPAVELSPMINPDEAMEMREYLLNTWLNTNITSDWVRGTYQVELSTY